MIALLRNSRGKDLENVVAHAQPSYARPRADIPQGVALQRQRAPAFGGGGPSFLERLFGGPTGASAGPNSPPVAQRLHPLERLSIPPSRPRDGSRR